MTKEESELLEACTTDIIKNLVQYIRSNPQNKTSDEIIESDCFKAIQQCVVILYKCNEQHKNK